MMDKLTLAVGGFGMPEILVILAIVVLLFGASRLPQLAKALGQSKRAFREGQDEADEEARIEEARRRERLRAADTGPIEDKRASDKYTSEKL
ncbi:MAG TPA: twin-arginine translocase TatA/TatE family subunit [Pyrinomonadaceae bacterium]|jgi:sec-independent protein translocase protein TatA